MERNKLKKSNTPCPSFEGTIMQTLLAKEMSDETSTKRRSPNLIAKLMGLDGLPSPQPTAKRTEKPFKHDQFNKKKTTEQQHFRDVYEDPQHVENRVYTSQVTAKSRYAKLQLGYIKERCDEMIRESIAIKTKLERVDSSPDLTLSFLQNGRQDIPLASNEIIVFKPSNASRYGSHGNALKEAVNCRVPASHRRNENGHLRYSCHCNNNSHRSSRYRLERKDATFISPTEIVVLKPNVVKNYIDKKFLRSADECRKNTESEFYRSEAKTRMSQRWKTNGYKDARMVGKSSTLEEMLSVSNGETRAHSETGYFVGPYEVSDGYGWRDEYHRSTSRSRSPPLSHNRSKNISDYYEAHADEKMMVHEKLVHRGKSKGVKGNLSDREDSRCETLQYSERCHTSNRSNACSPEFDDILPSRTYFEYKDPAEQESLISNIHDGTANAASVIDVCMLGDAESSAVDGDSLNPQEPATANAHVLEVSPTDDLSSGSDSFERVSSELHELRKQLHLLKTESGTTYDSPNDEDTEQISSSSCTVSESENLESTYLTDLLQHSNFYDHDPYTFISKWYTVDHHPPIHPRLSDHLEKKHSKVSRLERRLFHDRLNEALFLLSKSMVSWSFGQRGTKMMLTEIEFKDRLQTLLDKQEKEANWEFEDMFIDSDLDWFEPASETDFVGMQIAEVLVDELVVEIVSRHW
ncbi:hypothetical protein HanPI659440_Chr07g0270251 [Helianthus annuus]|nr:hypothetical protein HanPI659440_Chr07g0270251 [Helianthus annuus]